MISRELAQRFIERVSQHTDYNINIMDDNGIIIASREPSRIGHYHEIAYQIVHGTEDIMDTTGLNYPGVLPGINMVIAFDQHREGVVGVTGDPDEIRPIAMVVKMALETMLKYERQQEQLRLRTNKKEHFVYLLTHEERGDAETIRNLAAELGFTEQAERIPILLATKYGARLLLDCLRAQPLHNTRLDFSAALGEEHVLIFKSVPGRQEVLLGDYKDYIEAYLEKAMRPQDKRDQEAFSLKGVYVGSFQSSFENYCYAYRHCRWLEERYPGTGEIHFFYDCSGAYLMSRVPGRELQNVFRMYTEGAKKDKLVQYRQTAEALLGTNFHFQAAADKLFIHKNTLVYRYQALKAFLEIDPIAKAADRDFLRMFCEHLQKNAEE